jgi:hypothetical protein
METPYSELYITSELSDDFEVQVMILLVVIKWTKHIAILIILWIKVSYS